MPTLVIVFLIVAPLVVIIYFINKIYKLNINIFLLWLLCIVILFQLLLGKYGDPEAQISASASEIPLKTLAYNISTFLLSIMLTSRIIIFLAVVVYASINFLKIKLLTKITSLVFLIWSLLLLNGSIYLFTRSLSITNDVYAIYFDIFLTLLAYCQCFVADFVLKNNSTSN